jgi:pilus assembly protein Flp/PilA
VRTSEHGQTLVEYGLLIALIAVVAIAALLFLGPAIASLFSNIGTNLTGP